MADNNVTVSVNITVQIHMRRIYDLVVTGMESGGYGSFQFAENSGAWDADGWVLAEEGKTQAFRKIRIEDKYEDETFGKYLYDAALVLGLRRMADKYPKHFDNFMQENEDAITGDVFLQCVVFGEVIYG